MNYRKLNELIISMIFFIFIMSSCTSTKKYNNLLSENQLLKKRIEVLKSDSSDQAKKISSKKQQILDKEKEVKQLKYKIKESEKVEVVDLKVENKPDVNNDNLKTKANYIYNFAQNIHWKSLDYQKKYKIGVIDNPELKIQLEKTCENKMINGKKVEIESVSNWGDFKQYQLIVFNNKNKDEFKKYTKKFNSMPFLVVTDDFSVTNCNCISIYENNGQMKFKTANDTLKKNCFYLSSTLKGLK